MNIPESGGWGKADGQNRAGEGHMGLSGGLSRLLKDWLLVGIILLTGSLCFGLGLLAGKEEPKKGDSLWIEQLPKEEVPAASASTSVSSPTKSSLAPASSQPAAAAAALPTTGVYVASKTGTKYYLPTCGTAKRIKDENKVWFNTKEEAEKAGYQPGSNCKGL